MSDPATGTVSAKVRGVLSVFLVFHLTCVLLAPNSDNYAGMALTPLIQPYLTFFEMTNTWNFFSPNPEPPIYVEYELLDDQGSAYQSGRWPEEKDPYFLRERQTRRITAADFMVNSEISAEKMMVHYLCSQRPGPRALRLWRVMETLPRPQEITSGKRKLGDGVGKERKFVSHTFCESKSGGDGHG
jgi:hypothetical protein